VVEGPLGILGGTFDPVHTAHLRLAEEATRQLGLSGILWIPAGQPKHRATPVAAPEHRLAMVRLATANHPGYHIDDTEIRSGEPSYTVPTLERLRMEIGGTRPLVLLMGADAFLGLTTWHRWRDLFRLAHLGVASRPTFELAAAAMSPELATEWHSRRAPPEALARAPAGAIVDFPLSAGTVSSTEVRFRLRQGLAADELLPAPVLDYIRRHRLYSD
jgi:nicotinate-nucleotide adenylyltransferase